MPGPSRNCQVRALRGGVVHARRPRYGAVPNAAAALGCQCAVEARRMRCEEHGRRRAQRETRTRDGQGFDSAGRNLRGVSRTFRVQRAAHFALHVEREDMRSRTDKPWRERPCDFASGQGTRAPGRVAHAMVCAVSVSQTAIAGGTKRRPVPVSQATHRLASQAIMARRSVAMNLESTTLHTYGCRCR
jgi:hypothetical protein